MRTGRSALAWAMGVLVAAALGGGMAGPAVAEGIVFKKAKPAGTPRRIDVQITPEEDWYARLRRERARRAATSETDADAVSTEVGAALRPATADWFWRIHAPGLAAADESRLEAALRTLSQHPREAGPLQPPVTLYRELVARHGADILRATLGKKVSPALILAVIGVESAGRADAQSPAGAVGLMQLMAPTAARFEVADRTDPVQSIHGGAAYLDWLLEEFSGDPLLALAGYNAGEGAVRAHGGVPPFAETRDYIPKVVAAWGVARSFCMTPPRYATEGCVFRPEVSR